MGMSIADNIDFLNEAKKLFEDIANNPSINETVKAYFTIESLESAIDIMRKYQQLEDFAKWVAVEVIDEELWTYNYLSFAELACRKLVKLGIMQESNGEYTYEVVEDGNI